MSLNAHRKVIATTKVFFGAAVRFEHIERDPCRHEVSTTGANRDRDFCITPDMATTIVDACPDTQWKLMFALWRFAGLRKMEIFELRWNHVLWDKGKLLVTAPKTSHHAGRGTRYVPIGAILPYLEAAFDEAAEGSERIITRYSEANSNLAKPFEQILERAGLVVWPKLFQNLRSSCETEWLDAGFPAHVVACWIGHTVRVQTDHYAQVDEHHFSAFNNRVANFGAHLAQKTPEVGRTEGNGKKRNPAKTQCFHGVSSDFVSLRESQNALERSRTSTSLTDT